MTFRFRIEQVLPSIDGFEGSVIAGVRVGDTGSLVVGDALQIDTPDGQLDVRCSGFPLINWGQRGGDWVSIAVVGLPDTASVVGMMAISI
jgi:hypothetical protein